jgi:hypothetical protein
LADIALPWRPDPDTRTNLSKLGDVGLAIGSFLAGPAGAAGFLLGFAQQGSSGDPGPHYTVHLDPDAGLVSIGGLEGSAQAKTANVAFARTGYFMQKHKPEHQAILQQVFNTGKLQPGLPRAYEPVARALIELHNLFPQTPFVPPDGTGIPGIDARVPFAVEGGRQLSPPGPEFFMPRIFEVPPGGFAGFAQQTVAGQRQMAKTAGVRRRAGIVRASVGQRRSKSYRASGGGSRQFAARRKVRLVKGRRGRRAAYLVRGRKKKAHLVKGSAAAKAFMKRLRNMQGKAGRRRRRRRR